jgi:cytochrome c oxidase subunit II
MLVANVPLLPERACEQAAQVDYLIYFISAVTTAATVLVYILLIYLCSVYRRKGPSDTTPRILGSHKLELFWTIVPLITFLAMFVWGVRVYDQGFQVPQDAPEILVTGKQWMWKIQHPTGVREINELHLLVDQPVKLTLISEDVIHSFGVPAFRDKIDVLPARYVTAWYKPDKVGRYQIYCDQLCGIGHSQMIGWVHVMEKAEYEEWLNGARPQGEGPTDGSLAWEGRKLFLKLQCVSCHNSKGRAPLLEGIWETTVPLKGGGTALVNRSYIRESILKPRAKIHEGWEPIMPTFEEQLEDKSLGIGQEEAINALVAYIKSIGPGQTPTRTEQFAPPVGAPTEVKKKP